jgi:WD40 repeat protein
MDAKLVGQPKPSELYSLVQDAERFILSHMSVIKSTPLQIYSSALLFSPQASIVRNLFQKEIDWVRISSGVEQNWSSNLQTLEGHSSSVYSVVFSPDGSKLASGSGDRTVRVWDVATGQVERTLEGHSGSVRSVFSLASGQPEINHHHVESRSFYSVDESKCWVIRDGSKILYLPPDHRPNCIATEGSTLAIGSGAGRITIITF